MGPINNDNNDDLKEETRGRPTKGFSRMDVERKIRLDSEMDYLLQQKCQRLRCTIADGIREGIKLFILDDRYDKY